MPTRAPQSSRYRRFRFQALLVLGALTAVLVGCQKKAPPAAPNAPPTIPVSQLVFDNVTDFTEYTGRTDSVESVTIRPRVTGELKATPFSEGADVRGPVKLLGATLREGDVLFRIDSEPYQAAYDQADGQLKLYKAQKALAIANYDQDKRGFDAGTVSEFQMNQDKANIDQADARIKSADATLASARLNLNFCSIRAPLSGRISRYYYTPGNLASANSTMLTTIVSVDKMYGYFDVEERTYQQILQGLRPDSGGLSAVKVRMAIEGDTSESEPDVKPPPSKTEVKSAAGQTDAEKAAARAIAEKIREVEKKYPFGGELDFINNQVNPSTGTVALRAIFNNEKTAWYQIKTQTIETIQKDPKLTPEQKPPEAVLDKLKTLMDKPQMDRKAFVGELAKVLSPDELKSYLNVILRRAYAPGRWKLLPGMFVRIRIDLGVPKRQALVIDRAIGSDQGLKFVYVVDAEKKVQYRRVKTGSLQEGGLRVLEPYSPKTDTEPESGVKPDEWIVVGGLPQLRPKMEITPNQVAMPTTGNDTTQTQRRTEKNK